MAQFWVNDTPGGARTLSVPASQCLWGQGGDGGDPAHGPGSFAGLQDPLTRSGVQVPGGWPGARLGTPFSARCHPTTAGGAPTAPPVPGRWEGGWCAESSLRLWLPQFNSLPNLCHHPQKGNRGLEGCAGAQWPGDVASTGRPGDLPRCRPRGEGAPKHGPTRQLRGEKVRREIQDSLCVWTRPREAGAPRGK